MRTSSCVFLVFCLILFGNSTDCSAANKGRATAKEQQCSSLTDEQAAALVAQDWESLERLSKEFLLECEEAVTPQHLSDCAVNISIANNQLGRFEQAITAANECAKIYYANSGCHLEKAKALLSLGSRPEGIKWLNISEKLASHELENARRDFKRANSKSDKEFHGISINLCESRLREIGSIRSFLSNPAQ